MEIISFTETLGPDLSGGVTMQFLQRQLGLLAVF